ncbi:phosphatase PAP2 family protein [Imhoffiella purpurea]|uniref:undecaprenyl-diphosphate phosphatase n=1 Tax=Imhoffiella purpurea TaxID=1249627 RepID=W9W2P1_9GAMM|nr:phosphatase PAP2 family protein [Imhoffiella purpurea]EXJ16810.1 hypothetical protein D779_2421 [Imhoffiella purpurea]
MRASKPFGVPIAIWILFFTFADIMLAAPRIDLWVSGAFFSPETGFELREQPLERLLYWSVNVATTSVVVFLGGLWWFRRVPGRKLLYLLAVLILVPGLLVNSTLKEHWGRARPVQVMEFDGTRAFSPPFVPSDQGGGSFSSGHAAAAAYLVVVAAVLAGCRSWWVAAALIYSLMVGFVRIAAGGHFLSDVVTSFFLVLIGALMLYRLFFGRDADCRAAPD